MKPLRIQVCFHPDSERSHALANDLYSKLTERPGTRGARIPVRFVNHPDQIAEGGFEHEILVYLVETHMCLRAEPEEQELAAAWAVSLETQLAAVGAPGSRNAAVLPVSVDEAAFELSEHLEKKSFVRLEFRQEDADRHLEEHVSIRALRALRGEPGAAPGDGVPEAPINLFISHAKGDLPEDPKKLAEGPVRALLASLGESPVSQWYDAADIPAGADFEVEIEGGVKRCTLLIVVLTNTYSDREWCRRELVLSKMAGRPVILVDAMDANAERLFPYVGNAPVIRWRAAVTLTDNEVDQASAEVKLWWRERRDEWQVQDAADIITLAMTEALRYQHDLLVLQRVAEGRDHVLGTTPEALTISGLDIDEKPDAENVWYPDPPLGREELDRLGCLRDDLNFVTPLSRFARWERPSGLETVALSISGAPDAAQYGGSPRHLATLADDLVLYLLVSGLRIAYGGMLGHRELAEGDSHSDEVDYTDRLFGIVRSYSPMAKELGDARLRPILNFVGWPIYQGYGVEEKKCYGREAELVKIDMPADLQPLVDQVEPLPNGFFPPYWFEDDKPDFSRPLRRYAWSRSMTHMRKAMLEGTQARIVMGGKLTGYVGWLPGVLEEALTSLEQGQPLFLLGASGGAARLAIDALHGRPREELTTAWCEKNLPGWSELVATYQKQGLVIPKIEQIAQDLADLGGKDGANVHVALNNGLDREQNAELFECADGPRATELILSGLLRKPG